MTTNRTSSALIHPIIVYPFAQPSHYVDLRALYEGLVRPLTEQPDKYARPITVMNRQTFYSAAMYRYDPKVNEEFINFLESVVKVHYEVVDAWAVDSCQMWLAGFGKAFDIKVTGEDVYWLIPGDFSYSTTPGQKLVAVLPSLPDAVSAHEQDFAVGETKASPNSSKQLIDIYGTYGLLYNWFPQEAQEIRRITDKPRTEFFAIRHSFLREILRQRWYAYEQTIVILLHGVIGRKRIHMMPLADVSDLPQGRDTLAAAMTQVERTERVLKLFWRERNEHQADWPDRFRVLDAQSEQIRGAALVILQNLMR
jgi:hypothetical protein